MLDGIFGLFCKKYTFEQHQIDLIKAQKDIYNKRIIFTQQQVNEVLNQCKNNELIL